MEVATKSSDMTWWLAPGICWRMAQVPPLVAALHVSALPLSFVASPNRSSPGWDVVILPLEKLVPLFAWLLLVASNELLPATPQYSWILNRIVEFPPPMLTVTVYFPRRHFPCKRYICMDVARLLLADGQCVVSRVDIVADRYGPSRGAYPYADDENVFGRNAAREGNSAR